MNPSEYEVFLSHLNLSAPTIEPVSFHSYSLIHPKIQKGVSDGADVEEPDPNIRAILCCQAADDPRIPLHIRGWSTTNLQARKDATYLATCLSSQPDVAAIRIGPEENPESFLHQLVSLCEDVVSLTTMEGDESRFATEDSESRSVAASRKSSKSVRSTKTAQTKSQSAPKRTNEKLIRPAATRAISNIKRIRDRNVCDSDSIPRQEDDESSFEASAQANEQESLVFDSKSSVYDTIAPSSEDKSDGSDPGVRDAQQLVLNAIRSTNRAVLVIDNPDYLTRNQWLELMEVIAELDRRGLRLGVVLIYATTVPLTAAKLGAEGARLFNMSWVVGNIYSRRGANQSISWEPKSKATTGSSNAGHHHRNQNQNTDMGVPEDRFPEVFVSYFLGLQPIGGMTAKSSVSMLRVFMQWLGRQTYISHHETARDRVRCKCWRCNVGIVLLQCYLMDSLGLVKIKPSAIGKKALERLKPRYDECLEICKHLNCISLV